MRSMPTVLVQGAAGFVAHTLLPMLQGAGFQYFILVDPKPICDELITRLQTSGAELNIHLDESLFNIKISREPDLVISLAGQTDVDQALSQPRSAFSSNVQIAIELGEWLRSRKNKPRLIYMSSDEVLGESFSPLPEDAPLRPTQPYAASKAIAEIVLHNYRDVYNLNIVTLRSCNLVGGYQRARKLIPVVVKNILEGKPVPIYGDGRHQREWMGVEDICTAILLLSNPLVSGGIYQASSMQKFSTLEVVNIVARTLGKEWETTNSIDRQINDSSYSMSTNKLTALGWVPRIKPYDAIVNATRAMASVKNLSEFQFDF